MWNVPCEQKEGYSMRKLIFALVMTLTLLSTFTIGASAHTAPSLHSTRPQVATGGCESARSARGDLIASSCINRSGNNLNGDAYVTFQPQFPLGYIEGCYVQVIILGPTGQVGYQQFACAYQASNSEQGVHFGPITASGWTSGATYTTRVNIKLTYSAGAYSTITNLMSQPIYMS